MPQNKQEENKYTENEKKIEKIKTGINLTF